MGETVERSGGGLAMMDNYQARQFRDDYRSCRLIDVPKKYVQDKNAFIIAKGSPYRYGKRSWGKNSITFLRICTVQSALFSSS